MIHCTSTLPDGPSSRVTILFERFFQEHLFVKKTLVKWYIADTGQKMVHCKIYIFKRKTFVKRRYWPKNGALQRFLRENHL